MKFIRKTLAQPLKGKPSKIEMSLLVSIHLTWSIKKGLLNGCRRVVSLDACFLKGL